MVIKLYCIRILFTLIEQSIVIFHHILKAHQGLHTSLLSPPLDVDECTGLHGPCQGHECVNLLGTFRCECRSGFTFNTISRTCDGKSDLTHIQKLHKIYREKIFESIKLDLQKNNTSKFSNIS